MGEPHRRHYMQPVHIFLHRERRLPEPPLAAKTGIVNQQNQRRVRPDMLGRPAQIILLRQISLQCLCRSAELIMKFSGERVQSIFTPGYQNEIVLGREFARKCCADSAGGAGDCYGRSCQ